MPRPGARLLCKLLGSALLVAACGAAPRARDPDTVYHRIAELEARVDEGVRASDDPRSLAGATEVSCAAADELCALAAELGEQDALVRCERARRSCQGLRARR